MLSYIKSFFFLNAFVPPTPPPRPPPIAPPRPIVKQTVVPPTLQRRPPPIPPRRRPAVPLVAATVLPPISTMAPLTQSRYTYDNNQAEFWDCW